MIENEHLESSLYRKAKNASLQLKQAKAYLKNDKPAKAQEIPEKIPTDTGAGGEAEKLLD